MSAEPTLPISQPDGYAYRYHDGIRAGTNGRSINGSSPIETLPYFYKSTVDSMLAERDREPQQARAQLKSSVVAERKDCEKALLSLSGARYPTPVEGYGTNTSWAISDLCRALSGAREEIARLKDGMHQVILVLTTPGNAPQSKAIKMLAELKSEVALHPVPEKPKS